MCIHVYVYMYVCMHGCMHVYDHASFNSSGLSKSLLKTKNPAQMTAYRLLDYARKKDTWWANVLGFRVQGTLWPASPTAVKNARTQRLQYPLLKEYTLNYIRDPTIIYGIFP